MAKASPFGSMPKGKSAPSTKQQPSKGNSHKGSPPPKSGAKMGGGISPGVKKVY